MRFRIPHAPRKVRVTQIPGAVLRLVTTAGVACAVLAVLTLGARMAADRYVEERRFLREAHTVTGTVAEVRLPLQEDGPGAVDVLYEVDGVAFTGSRLPIAAEDARGLRQGLPLELRVDPRRPSVAREARLAAAEAKRLDWVPYGIAAGALLGLVVMGRELLRTVRSDLEPLRRGLLVWLTPAEPLPDTRKEIVFRASYHREDVKHEVKARIRPGRAPVRNGEKVLAAVIPSRPTWARVVDEDLAKSLGWWG